LTGDYKATGSDRADPIAGSTILKSLLVLHFLSILSIKHGNLFPAGEKYGKQQHREESRGKVPYLLVLVGYLACNNAVATN